MMQLGPRGRALIQGFEQLALKAYRKFPGEPWTAGYGHTGPDVTEDTVCTVAQAEAWFDEDTSDAVHAVNMTVHVPLTQSQFDALVAFTYNVGAGAEAHSTLVRLVNAGDLMGAAAEFAKWDHVNGVVVSGLDRRRAAERDLFLTAA